MKLEEHVQKAIEDFNQGHKESALMHACMALDATSKKLYGSSGKKKFKDAIRQYWWIFQRFVGDGIDHSTQTWPHVAFEDGYGKLIKTPDTADIIYHIHRCNHCHGEQPPVEFSITESTSLVLNTDQNGIQLSEKIVWALLAICVFCHKNSDTKTESDHYLSWTTSQLKIGSQQHTTFLIAQHWGKEKELKSFFKTYPEVLVNVKISLPEG